MSETGVFGSEEQLHYTCLRGWLGGVGTNSVQGPKNPWAATGRGVERGEKDRETYGLNGGERGRRTDGVRGRERQGCRQSVPQALRSVCSS